MRYRLKYILTFLINLLLIVLNGQSFAQENPADSLSSNLEQIEQIGDTIKIRSSGGIDSLLISSAKDSVILNLKTMKLRMRGDVKINYQTQKLNAEVVEVDLRNSLMDATGIVDSTGKYIGFPQFIEMGKEFFGERIRFNFKNNKGIISLGETELDEGFYFGEKIKRVNQSSFFIEGGYYTTCDAPDPHFHFGSNKMKLVAEDRIFIDPLIFYVEDLPIFILPIGLFFPTQSGRQSGLIVPSFFFSANRGVVFENLGFYWAASDYFDTKITFDIYSKGGIMSKSSSQWALKDVTNGSLNLSYGKTRFDVDDDWKNNYNLSMRGAYTIDPTTKISSNLNFSSSDFYQKTSTNPYERLTQNMTSNADFSTSWDNGNSLSLSYSRDQNIINDDYSQSVPLRFNMPNFLPLKGVANPNSWLSDVTMGYSMQSEHSTTRRLQTDSTIETDNKFRITHRPTLSISPKLGYFNVSPSISFSGNNFLRKMKRKFDMSDSTVVETFEDGFYTEYWASFGLGVSTRIFGITDDNNRFFGFIKPSSFGVKAFRHTWEPRLSFSYTPDFSNLFWDEYTDESGVIKKYSIFEKDGGSHAPSYLSQNLRYSDNHKFELKIAQGDTLDDKIIEIMKINYSINYDFTADDKKWSNLTMGFRTPQLNFLSFKANATFSLYDQEEIFDDEGKATGRFQEINQLMIDNGNGLMRLKVFSFDLNTNISSKGISFDEGFSEAEDTRAKIEEDSLALGDRFRLRQSGDYIAPDLFGDSSPGYTSVSIPWSLGAGLRFSYNEPTIDNISRNIDLTARLNITLTPTLRFDADLGYNLVENELVYTNINLTKDLHCWELTLRWTPTGPAQGFYLRFGIRASMLQDLKIEKHSSPIY